MLLRRLKRPRGGRCRPERHRDPFSARPLRNVPAPAEEGGLHDRMAISTRLRRYRARTPPRSDPAPDFRAHAAREWSAHPHSTCPEGSALCPPMSSRNRDEPMSSRPQLLRVPLPRRSHWASGNRLCGPRRQARGRSATGHEVRWRIGHRPARCGMGMSRTGSLGSAEFAAVTRSEDVETVRRGNGPIV